MNQQTRNSVVRGIFAQNVDVEHQHIVHFVALLFVKVISINKGIQKKIKEF